MLVCAQCCTTALSHAPCVECGLRPRCGASRARRLHHASCDGCTACFRRCAWRQCSCRHR
eukprot:361814-Chlamydomonas_euryale.AAC.8